MVLVRRLNLEFVQFPLSYAINISKLAEFRKAD